MPRIKNPQQLHDAVAQFVAVITPHVGSIPGMTAGQLTAITTKNGTLATDITAQIAAEEAAEAATETTKNRAADVNTDWDALVLLVRAATTLDPAIVVAAGLPIRDTVPTPVIPVAPTELTAKGFDTGVNSLKWKSGGNLRGVTYIIEYRVGTTDPFQFLDTTTRTTYDHTGRTPGQRVEYRVKAKRTTHESAYSNTAVVYA